MELIGKITGIVLSVAICGLLLGAAHWLGMLHWWTAGVVVFPTLGVIGSILFESDSDSDSAPGSPASTDKQEV